MNRKFILVSTLVSILLGNAASAQAPGGVSTGLKAWFHAEAGTTVSPSNTITAWANQVTNANLATLTAGGGATSLVSTNAVPFNFHSFLQHAAGCMYFPTSVTNTDVLATTEGSMIGVGTASDQLICLTGNSTASPFGSNRANSGTRGATTEFGNGTVAGVAPYATGTVLNTGKANIFGLRAKVGVTPAQQNTYNGLMNTGTAATRPAGSYRFAIGSFTGYYYGTNKSAEAICYNRQLTPDEFTRVQSYLAVKYGITLGTATTPLDYLSSASSVIWTGDATYQNNVTGIGRDDASGLIQKESKAVTAGSKVAIYNDNTAGTFPAMNVDNTTTFAADQSFVMFGDNKGDTVLNTCALSGKAVRIGRIWKMVKTGTVGDVTIAFTATDLPAGLTNLLVSADNTFAEAATTVIPLTTSGTLKYAVMPAGNTYFTFSADPVAITLTPVNITCLAVAGGSISSSVTGGLAPISYSWNTVPAQTTANITNVQAGNYTLTVTQAAGCASTQTASVVNDFITLTANLLPKEVKCNGDNNGVITVNNTNGTPAYSYSLNNQNNWGPNNRFDNLSAGFYKVYMKDANGCEGNDTVSITEPDPLSLTIKPMDDYCEVSADPNGNASIVLTGGTIPYTVLLNSANVGPSLTLTGLKEGHYDYQVIDKNGCQIEDTFSIAHIPCCYVFVPNAFSPNGDGKNDVFKLESMGNITLNNMTIYNRWGQHVYSSYNLQSGWDGTSKGAPVEVGTYFYTIKYTCRSLTGPKVTELKGDVTVIR